MLPQLPYVSLTYKRDNKFLGQEEINKTNIMTIKYELIYLYLKYCNYYVNVKRKYIDIFEN